MKISHESPKQLLQKSLGYNDYQYILPYFYFRDEEYKNFMLNYRKSNNSFIILDNGLFEGETYTIDALIALVNEIQPDIFIVPDEWNDATITHVNAKYWAGLKKTNIIPECVNIMVVLQGESFNEIKQLYQKCIDLGYSYFSFNHTSNSYNDPIFNRSKSTMRSIMVQQFFDDGIIKPHHYIHLLGAIDINEFALYKLYLPNVINSIDTSSPILRGCQKERYNMFTSITKPEGNIKDFYDKDLDSEQISCILKNIIKFNQLINK